MSDLGAWVSEWVGGWVSEWVSKFANKTTKEIHETELKLKIQLDLD